MQNKENIIRQSNKSSNGTYASAKLMNKAGPPIR